MDLCRYLSDKNHYVELMKAGENELRRRGFTDRDEIDDISSAALERLLDYFQRRPDKFLQIEEKSPEELTNYMKKALRNHVLNVISRQSRLKKIHDRMLQDPFTLFLHDLKIQVAPLEDMKSDPVDSNGDRWRNLSWEQIRNEIFYYIEETYGRAKWRAKKETADFFLERLREGLPLRRMKGRYPERNIASMNTEGHRLIRNFRQWVLNRHRKPMTGQKENDDG